MRHHLIVDSILVVSVIGKQTTAAQGLGCMKRLVLLFNVEVLTQLPGFESQNSS